MKPYWQSEHFHITKALQKEKHAGETTAIEWPFNTNTFSALML